MHSVTCQRRRALRETGAVIALALSFALLTAGIAGAEEAVRGSGSARSQMAAPQNLLANGLFFVGSVSYQYSGGTVRILANRVENDRAAGTLSGTLRLSLWATSQPPIFGQTVTGYMTASYTLGQLQGGFAFNSIDTGNIAFTRPPDGTYYFTLFLDEFQNSAFGYQDFVITSPTQTFGSPSVGCVVNSTTLCLNGGRFRVSVGWQALNIGTSGAGQAVTLTSDTGYFWFFTSNNIELVIKVVDGRPVNGKFWYFSGALTDVQYLVTVTDTLTGVVNTYFYNQGQQASFNDTSAF